MRTFENLGGAGQALWDISQTLVRHPEKKYKRRTQPPKRIVVHCSDLEISPQELAVFDTAPNHISSTGCPAITYHQVYEESRAFKTLDYDEISWHVGLWNKGSLGVCLLYKPTDEFGMDSFGPPLRTYQTAVQQIAKLCLKFRIPPYEVYGHRELKGTGWFFWKGSRRLRKTCPGLEIDLDRMRSEIGMYIQLSMEERGVYSGEIDGIFGPLSQEGLRNQLRRTVKKFSNNTIAILGEEEIKNLKIGDHFLLYEPTGEVILWPSGFGDSIALSNPYRISNSEGEIVWGIDCKEKIKCIE